MKKNEIKVVIEALKRIKMPKIEDKELRNVIIKNHLVLLGAYKQYESDIEDLRIAHLGNYEDELKKVQELQSSLQIETDREKIKSLVEEINSHKDLREAMDGFNKAVNDLGNETVDKITAIPADKFVEEYGKQDYDMGVVEAIFPLFE